MSKQFLGFKLADYWHVEIYFLVPFMLFAIWWMMRVLTLLSALNCHL